MPLGAWIDEVRRRNRPPLGRALTLTRLWTEVSMPGAALGGRRTRRRGERRRSTAVQIANTFDAALVTERLAERRVQAFVAAYAELPARAPSSAPERVPRRTRSRRRSRT